MYLYFAGPYIVNGLTQLMYFFLMWSIKKSRNRLPATYITRSNKIILFLVRTLNGSSVAMVEVFRSMSELNGMS